MELLVLYVLKSSYIVSKWIRLGLYFIVSLKKLQFMRVEVSDYNGMVSLFCGIIQHIFICNRLWQW